jgi:hypothetical protein
MTTETQTLTTVTVKDAKPSEIVRSLSPDRWCRGVYWRNDGYTQKFCSIGILLEEAGVDWGPDSPDFCSVSVAPVTFSRRSYGLPYDVVAGTIALNDDLGKRCCRRLPGIEGVLDEHRCRAIHRTDGRPRWVVTGREVVLRVSGACRPQTFNGESHFDCLCGQIAVPVLGERMQLRVRDAFLNHTSRKTSRNTSASPTKRSSRSTPGHRHTKRTSTALLRWPVKNLGLDDQGRLR